MSRPISPIAGYVWADMPSDALIRRLERVLKQYENGIITVDEYVAMVAAETA